MLAPNLFEPTSNALEPSTQYLIHDFRLDWTHAQRLKLHGTECRKKSTKSSEYTNTVFRLITAYRRTLDIDDGKFVFVQQLHHGHHYEWISVRYWGISSFERKALLKRDSDQTNGCRLQHVPKQVTLKWMCHTDMHWQEQQLLFDYVRETWWPFHQLYSLQ
jgi:hypothetical protein